MLSNMSSLSKRSPTQNKKRQQSQKQQQQQQQQQNQQQTSYEQQDQHQHNQPQNFIMRRKRPQKQLHQRIFHVGLASSSSSSSTKSKCFTTFMIGFLFAFTICIYFSSIFAVSSTMTSRTTTTTNDHNYHQYHYMELQQQQKQKMSLRNNKISDNKIGMPSSTQHHPSRNNQKIQQQNQQAEPHNEDSLSLPRMIFYDFMNPNNIYPIDYENNADKNKNFEALDSSTKENQNIIDGLPESHNIDKENENECVPMAKWQTQSYLNCNNMHEIDIPTSVLISSGGKTAPNSKTGTLSIEQNYNQQYPFYYPYHNISSNSTSSTRFGNMYTPRTSSLIKLGQGWFRDTWKYSILDSKHISDNVEYDVNEAVVIKTLRYERDFMSEEFMELHRRDATAMERLTHSKFVIDIYGYCGQSVINELAEYLQPKNINSIEKFDRQLRGKDNMPYVNHIKLKMGASIALGLAHIHESIPPDVVMIHKNNGNDYDENEEVDSEGDNNNDDAIPDYYPTMVHYDINPRNIAIVEGGRPKINDFNVAKFLTWRKKKTNSNDSNQQEGKAGNNLFNEYEICDFEGHLHEPWWRAPEEVGFIRKVSDDNNTITIHHKNHNSTPHDNGNEIIDYPPLTEKVDIYSLGNILYHILTTRSPRGKMKDYNLEKTKLDVRNGKAPILPSFFKNSKHQAHIAFKNAMDLCFQLDPKKRGTAKQIAKILFDALVVEKNNMNDYEDDKKKHYINHKNDNATVTKK